MDNVNFDLNTIAYLVGTIATLITGLAVIYKFVKKSIGRVTKDSVESMVDDKVADIESDLTDAIHSLHNDVNSLSETIETHIAKTEQDMADVKKTLCDEVREKITRIHNECIRSGRITQHQLYIVEQLYEDYEKRLNGNSFVSTLMDDLRDLYKNQNLDI